MAEQQLSLKITGDSEQAVTAVGELAQTIQAALEAMAGQSAEMTTAVTAVVDDYSSALSAMSGMVEQPFTAMADAATQTTEDTHNKFVTMFDDILTSAATSVAAVGDELKSFGSHIEAGFSDPIGHVKEELKSLLESIGPIGVGLAALVGAVSAVGVGLFDLTKTAAAAGEKIENFALITGTSVEKIGALSATAQIAGGSLDGMQSMLTQMTRRLDASGPAAEKMNRALADINISSEEFRAAAPDERIAMLATGFQNAADKSKNMSDAIAIMGRSGVSNLPLLMHMTDDVRTAGEKLGYTWSEQDTQASTTFNQALQKIAVQISTLTTTIGVEFIPALTWIVDGFGHVVTAVEYASPIIALRIGMMFGPIGVGITLLAELALGITKLVETKADAALKEATYGAVTDSFSAAWAKQARLGLDLKDATYAVADAKLKEGFSVETVAAQTGLAVEEVRRMVKAHDDAKKAGEEYAAVLDRITQAEEDYGLVEGKTTAADKAAILYYQNLGLSVQDIATAMGMTTGAVTAVEAAMTKAQAAADAYAKKLDAVNSAMFGEKDAIYVLQDWFSRNSVALSENADAADRFAQRLVQLRKGGADLTEEMKAWLKAQDAFNDSIKEYDILTAIRQSVETEALKNSTDEWDKWATHQNQILTDNIVAHLTGARDLKKIDEDIATFEDNLHKTALQKQIDAIEAQKWAREAAFDGEEAQREAFNTKVEKLADDQTAALMTNWGALTSASRTSLQETADKAWSTYAAALADSDNYTDKAIANFLRLANQAERAADDSGSAWGTMFEQTFAKDMPRILSSAFEGGGGLAGGLKSLGTGLGKNISTNIMGNADEGTGLMGSLFPGDGGGLAQNLVEGFASAGITSAISIGANLLIKGLTALFGDHTADDIARDSGMRFGTTFSKATSDAILKDKNAGMTEMAAELNNLTGIIKDAGGLSETNLPQLTARLHDVFSMIETHQMTIAQGTKVIDDNWQAFATAGTAADGRLSDSLQAIIKLNDTFGTQSKAIATYLQGQGTNAMTGFSAVVAGVITPDKLAVWDALHQKLHDTNDVVRVQTKDWTDWSGATQAAITATENAANAEGVAAESAQSGLVDLGTQAVATWAAAVAGGMSETDALKAIHPALSTLSKAYDDLGLKTDDAAFAALMMRDKIVTAAPAMVNGISGLNQEMISLDNMGLLNVKTFGAMERSGQTMYDELSAKVKEMGGTDTDVLSEMQSYLHEAATSAKNLGIPLDDNTQKLVDQSKTAGIWQDALTPQDKLLGGIQSLVDKVSALVDKLSGIPPKIDTTVTTHFVTDGDPNALRGAGTEPLPSFANRPMEQVTSAGLAMLHPGDLVGVPQGGLFGGAGGAMAHLANMADGIGSLNDAMAALPDAFARKVRDAVQQAG